MTVYFIQPEDEPVVKIGFALSDAALRLKNLQVANHRKLRLLASVGGTRGQELGLHFLLREHHILGEWFHLTDEVRGIIAKAKRSKRYRGPTIRELKYPLSLKTPEQRAESDKRRGPRKRTKKDRRMPWDQVLKLYLDPRLSNDELEIAITAGGKHSGMSYDTMRRHFKRLRGAPTGRPSRNRKPAIL